MPKFDDIARAEFRALYDRQRWDAEEMPYSTWFNTLLCSYIGNFPDVDLDANPEIFVNWVRQLNAPSDSPKPTHLPDKPLIN